METGLQKIKEAAAGFLYLSEGDFPFEVFCIDKVSSSLEDQLLALSGKPKGTEMETETLEYFFRNMVKVYPDPTPVQHDTGQRFQHLKRVLEEELSDVKVYRIGSIRIDAFIIGKLKDGNYGGLRTKVIET